MRAWIWPMTLTQLTGCMGFHKGPMPGEPTGATYVQTRDTRVRYIDVGAGPAVVLLHGFASSLETWAAVIPALEKTHRVIALDLRGFGWTDRPEADYSPQGQAELVLEVLDHLGVDRAAVVGHSWGASVALALTLRAPARVTRLALYDAWAYESQLPSFFVWARLSGVGETLFSMYYREQAERRLALAFHDKRHVTPELIDAVYKAMERPGTVAAALATVRGQRFTEVERRYREIDKPTLILWGREDRVSALAMGERLQRDLRQAQLRTYARCGHFPMLEAASESTGDLVQFLSGERVALTLQ
jgi:pimeloyl-ACP methyl ester carboxylesterase